MTLDARRETKRTPPPERMFRYTRGLNPLVLTSWDHIRRGERGRWDDTGDEYRVLYASDSEVGAFVEVLQDLRQSANGRAALEEIEHASTMELRVPTLSRAVSAHRSRSATSSGRRAI